MSAPPFAAFYFDCDSTLTTVEGIDELAASRPASVRSEIADLTNAAMDGTVSLREVYERRLEILRPSREDLVALGALYVDRLVPGAERVVRALTRLGKRVGVVSGGLEPGVRALGRHLGVSAEDVHAVPIRFRGDGGYAGFDRSSPLWRNQGKVTLLERLRAEASPLLYVGDGVTDLEAQPVVDLFVGYGGVARREALAREASVYREDPDLGFLLEIGLTEEERARLKEGA